MTRTLLMAPANQALVESALFSLGLGIAAGAAGNSVSSSYYNGNTYIGLVDGNGNARVVAYTHSTHTSTVSPEIVTGLGSDVHCTPSVLVRSSDHKLVVAVAAHDTIPAVHMYVAISTNAEDVSAWGAATDIKTTLGGTSYTYANLFQLSGESGKIYLFYRDEQNAGADGALSYSTSTDGGATWAAQTTLYKNAGKQCYWCINSDDTSRIDFVVSDGAAPNGDAASVYHFYYSGGSRFKSDGTTISATLPLAPANLTKIHNSTSGASRQPYHVLTNSGNPVTAYAVYDPSGSGSNEQYWYGTCSSGTWTTHEITDSGSHPDTNFQEGGICIDATNANRVFLSKKTSSVWQIYKYETSDSGASWSSVQLTTDSTSAATDIYNLRPIPPRNANAALTATWCFGPHWALSSGAEPPAAQLRGYPNPVVS